MTTTARTVEFPSNGSVASGYLVTPPSGSAPGVLVVQKWWGLDSGIKVWPQVVSFLHENVR